MMCHYRSAATFLRFSLSPRLVSHYLLKITAKLSMQLRATLETPWEHSGTFLGALRKHYGPTLGALWEHFDCILGALWEHFDSTLGAF